MKKNVLTIVIILSTLLLNISSQAQCHIDDWTALKALYESTDGDNWINNTGWQEVADNVPSANCNLENLYGIDLDNEGRVHWLNLGNNQLYGTIPPELGNLIYLTLIYMGFNQLSSEIPAEIANLTNLIILELSENQLSGSIPPELGNLSSLTDLYLDSNQFSGSIPPELDNLSNLTYLNLGFNQFSGNIPPELGNLSNLDQLFLRDNQLSGNIPIELSNLEESLRVLYLENNQLTGSIPNRFGDLISLEYLSTGNNQLTGSIPASIGNLSNLGFLLLNNNQLTGNIPPEIGNLSYLGELDLSNNQLSGSLPPELSNVIYLTLFQVNNNNLSGCYNDTLTNLCAQFGNIDISDGNNFDATWEDFCNLGSGTCPISNPQCHIDDWNALKALYESTDGDNWTNRTGWDIMIDNLSNPPTNCNLGDLYGIILSQGRVADLYLLDNQLNGNIPPELGNLSSLSQLTLSHNQLSGNIPSQLGNLTNLGTLSLFNNELSGSIPSEIGNLSNLSNLILTNNQLSGSIPASLGNLNNLYSFSLGKNQLTGSLPPELGNLSSLSSLYLDNNRLSGSIPTILGDLTNLRNLDLSSNQLSGNIPPELGNLVSLTNVWLGSNQLSGSISGILGDLTNLRYLDLSSNQLSGTIPPELGNLISLTDLRLGSNQLSGSIPPELGNISNLGDLTLDNNQFSGSIPSELGNLSYLVRLDLSSNQLTGSIPPELGNLDFFLYVLHLDNNQLTGNIPPELSNLNAISDLSLQSNQLVGTVPWFNSSNNLNTNISNNNLSCNDLSLNFSSNDQSGGFIYSPQFFDEPQSHVIDEPTIALEQTSFPSTLNSPSYQWKKNDVAIVGANNDVLTINNAQLEDAGVYTLHITDDCVPDIEFISEPHYVVYAGYDLTGQPVIEGQIMVEFSSPEETTLKEESILYANYGWIVDSCNCNRELYLWEFPSTGDLSKALIELEIDKRLKTVKSTIGGIRGGFNNSMSTGNINNTAAAYNIPSNITGSYPDEVTICILDTGLDETGLASTPCLMAIAPVDNCYMVNQAAGYNYITEGITIDDNFLDDQGHGTFGFRCITDELSLLQPNNIDVFPLKAFNQSGKGNLFDLTCAIYHAIDHGADIINISASYQGQRSGILENAINLAREQGVFICAAAGNDSLNNDSIPQYPAYFAGLYHYELNANGDTINSIRYDNVISVAAINAQNNLADFSNWGAESVTLSAYGENIHSYGLGGYDAIASGSSMATYFVSRELALEIAMNKNRPYQEILTAFENNRLVHNPSTVGKTRTGKRLNVPIEQLLTNCTVINTESFETGWGIWKDGGEDCRRNGNRNFANTGKYSVHLRDNTNTSVVTTNNLDLSTFDEITIAFSYYTRSMDYDNEDFWLQLSTDGGTSFTTIITWNKGDEFENKQREDEFVMISGPFSQNTQLRFRCDASGNGDNVYIDDIEISGCVYATTAPRPDEGASPSLVILSDIREIPIKIPVLQEATLILPGCTDVDAINYDPSATIDDGTCENSHHLYEYNKKISLPELEVFPNPNNGQFSISFQNANKGEIRLKVYNLNMELVYELSDYSQAGIYHNKIDFTNKLGSGIYVLEVITDGQNHKKKMVVNR